MNSAVLQPYLAQFELPMRDREPGLWRYRWEVTSVRTPHEGSRVRLQGVVRMGDESSNSP